MTTEHTTVCRSVDLAMEFVTLARNEQLVTVAERIQDITISEAISVIIALSSFSSTVLVGIETISKNTPLAFADHAHFAANFRLAMPCTCTEDT